jgi:futalosine hydrolase
MSHSYGTFFYFYKVMNCLVAAATVLEISPFIDYFNHSSKQGTDILITGIGMTAATYALTKQCSIKKPGLVIQAGVGGCFDNSFPLGSVVVVKKETIADQSVIEFGKLKTLFDLKLVRRDQYPFTNGWLLNKNEFLKKIKLKKVTGISVNEITASEQKIKFYTSRFNPVIESMEGAALHYVCLMEKIPFIQLRGISNYVGERDKKKWKMKEAVTNLNNALIGLLHKL